MKKIYVIGTRRPIRWFPLSLDHLAATIHAQPATPFFGAGIKSINTAGQNPVPVAYGGFPQQSANLWFGGVLNPIFPHSLDHVRACCAYAAAISLISSIKTT